MLGTQRRNRHVFQTRWTGRQAPDLPELLRNKSATLASGEVELTAVAMSWNLATVTTNHRVSPTAAVAKECGSLRGLRRLATYAHV
jgi:hypothetical protein